MVFKYERLVGCCYKCGHLGHMQSACSHSDEAFAASHFNPWMKPEGVVSSRGTSFRSISSSNTVLHITDAQLSLDAQHGVSTTGEEAMLPKVGEVQPPLEAPTCRVVEDLSRADITAPIPGPCQELMSDKVGVNPAADLGGWEDPDFIVGGQLAPFQCAVFCPKQDSPEQSYQQELHATTPKSLKQPREETKTSTGLYLGVTDVSSLD